MSHCLNPHCPQPKNSSNEQFCITCGTKILLKERYRAIRPLGAGGMGKTFLAIDEDTPSKRQCVIKQFSPGAETANNSGVFQKAKELFNREAATLDRLGRVSSHIPALLAYLEQDQRLYLVQEFIDGQNLFQEQLQHGNYSEAQVRQLLNDLLPVLQLIHQQGVIHRDIKPENIMRRHDGYQQRYQTVAEVLADLNAPPALAASPTPALPSISPPSLSSPSLPQPASSLSVSSTGQSAAISTEKPVSKRFWWIGGSIAVAAGLVGFSLWSLDNSSTSTKLSGQEEIALTPTPSEPAKTAQDYLNEGNTYQDQGDYQAALAVIERAIELEPTAEAYFERGFTHHYLSNFQSALDDYSTAIELDPNYADAYVVRGLAHYNLGDNLPALADYGKAIELDPNNAAAYYNRGLIHQATGYVQEARSDFQQAANLHQQQGNTQYYQDALARLEELQ
jgi:serine/threonine protein kinase